MPLKAQDNSGGALIGLLIIVVLVVGIYFYYEGYISFPIGNRQTNSSNPVTPVSLNVSSTGSLSGLYGGQSFNIVTSLYNYRDSNINVSLLPYGCSTISTGKKYLTLLPGEPTSRVWSFTAPSSGTCNIQFTACFSYSSFANYPLTIKNSSQVTAPVNSPTFSNAPIALSIPNLGSTIVAPPAAVYPGGINQTEYINAQNIGSGTILNDTFDWLDVSDSNGVAYIELSNGVLQKITSTGVNMSVMEPNYRQMLFFNGNFILPIILNVPPILNANGYEGTTLSISNGYTYCVQSTPLQVSVS
jgi:hypothetical protein